MYAFKSFSRHAFVGSLVLRGMKTHCRDRYAHRGKRDCEFLSCAACVECARALPTRPMLGNRKFPTPYQTCFVPIKVVAVVVVVGQLVLLLFRARQSSHRVAAAHRRQPYHRAYLLHNHVYHLTLSRRRKKCPRTDGPRKNHSAFWPTRRRATTALLCAAFDTAIGRVEHYRARRRVARTQRTRCQIRYLRRKRYQLSSYHFCRIEHNSRTHFDIVSDKRVGRYWSSARMGSRA